MKTKLVLLTTLLLATGILLSAQGLMVEPGTCIKVEAGFTLDISGGGHLTLKSDDTGDASLIDLGSVNHSGGGEAKVERYLTHGKWHLISAPVADIVAGQFEGDYLQVHNETTNEWTDVSSMTYDLVPAKGYALWTVDGQPTIEMYAGTTNTNNQSFNFTQNGTGWNLVGNPYPSVLDWDAVTIPSELSGAIWLFDPTVGSNGDYKYYLSGGGASNTATPYIPSGQGFFVRATGGSGTLTLQNNDRTHGGQTFYKSDVENQMLVLKAIGNNILTQTAIRFIPEATAQVDRLFDVSKIISGSNDVPNVYTHCENEKMAINTLPSIAGHETVPVYFEAGMDGTYRFIATALETLDESIPVFLEDVSLNYVQDLRANPEYSFAYSTGAEKEFKVHFKDVNSVDEVSFDSPPFHCYLSSGLLHVHYMGSDPFSGKASISVYNTAGQLILETQITQTSTTHPLRVTAALYLVHIQFNQSMYSTKLINR